MSMLSKKKDSKDPHLTGEYLKFQSFNEMVKECKTESLMKMYYRGIIYNKDQNLLIPWFIHNGGEMKKSPFLISNSNIWKMSRRLK